MTQVFGRVVRSWPVVRPGVLVDVLGKWGFVVEVSGVVVTVRLCGTRNCFRRALLSDVRPYPHARA